jgi:hypothetical protein
LPPTERSSNEIWTSGVAKEDGVPKVFDAKELVM